MQTNEKEENNSEWREKRKRDLSFAQRRGKKKRKGRGKRKEEEGGKGEKGRKRRKREKSQKRGELEGELRFHHNQVRVRLIFITIKSMIL